MNHNFESDSHNYNHHTYTEMIASFSIPRSFGPKFDLLLGFDPKLNQFTSDESDPFLALKYLDRQALLANKHHWPVPIQWLETFPDIDKYLSLDEFNIYDYLWEEVIAHVNILDIAYAFYPMDLTNLQQRKDIKESAENIHRSIEKKMAQKINGQEAIGWVLQFPQDGPLGQIVEKKAGISLILKNKLGLFNYRPGLLFNYLLNHKIPIETLLDPYQFEDLVGMIFKSEGWNVTRMRKTRDGGKDIIATHSHLGSSTTVYIQAKKYAHAKVNIHVVKEFVATVAGDKADKGIIVTTSYYTRPSTNWLNTNGLSVAAIELIDKQGLKKKLQDIIDSETPVYLLE